MEYVIRKRSLDDIKDILEYLNTIFIKNICNYDNSFFNVLVFKCTASRDLAIDLGKSTVGNSRG